MTDARDWDAWAESFLSVDGDERYTRMAVCADAMDEAGEPDLAYALRWCAERRRFPEVAEDPWRRMRLRWMWRRQHRNWRDKPDTNFVSSLTLECMGERIDDGRTWFDTLGEAFRALADALARLRAESQLPSRLRLEAPHLANRLERAKK